MGPRFTLLAAAALWLAAAHASANTIRLDFSGTVDRGFGLFAPLDGERVSGSLVYDTSAAPAFPPIDSGFGITANFTDALLDIDYDDYAIDNVANPLRISQLDHYANGTEAILFSGRGTDATTGFGEFMEIELRAVDLFADVAVLAQSFSLPDMVNAEFYYVLFDTLYPQSEFRGTIDTLSVSVVSLPHSLLLVVPAVAYLLARRRPRQVPSGGSWMKMPSSCTRSA